MPAYRRRRWANVAAAGPAFGCCCGCSYRFTVVRALHRRRLIREWLLADPTVTAPELLRRLNERGVRISKRSVYFDLAAAREDIRLFVASDPMRMNAAANAEGLPSAVAAGVGPSDAVREAVDAALDLVRKGVRTGDDRLVLAASHATSRAAKVAGQINRFDGPGAQPDLASVLALAESRACSGCGHPPMFVECPNPSFGGSAGSSDPPQAAGLGEQDPS